MTCSIAIDIGNTRTHLGLISPDNRTCLKRIDFSSVQIEKNLLDAVNDLTEACNREIKCIIVSGGIRNAVERSLEILSQSCKNVFEFKYTRSFPVRFEYKDVSVLGSDRIAHALYGNFAFPGQSLIIIGSGTAITADLLIKGKFMGGAILPGINMQLNSLHRSTDALPDVYPEGDFSLPGKSTEQCILTGVMNGTAGALEKIINRYKEIFPEENFRIIASGGAWTKLEDIVKFRAEFFPDMTLLGVSLFPCCSG